MPSPSTSTVSRKRTRSTSGAPPKRQRNNYSLRDRSVTSDTPRYNLRPRPSRSQVRLPEISTSRRRHPISSTHSNTTAQEQSRQYRLVYISDNGDDGGDQPTTTTTAATTLAQSTPTIMNTTFNLVTDDEDEEPRRPAVPPRRTGRLITTTPTPSTSENSDYSTGAVAHIRLNRAIEIVIDSIQSLEGAVNNFDQLVLGLIYGRLSTRAESENFEGMIRLSRILNLNFPSRLTQDEIDALPKIKFFNQNESTSSSSILLVEKCPICLTEFLDQEIINQLHCTHLFHLPCISTWLNENDSCPTCRRKVNGE